METRLKPAVTSSLAEVISAALIAACLYFACVPAEHLAPVSGRAAVSQDRGEVAR